VACLAAAAFFPRAPLLFRFSAQTFTHISTHNAYHVGEIIYVRKEQGSWDPKNGVN
jgi:hypothetical protein